MLVKYLLREDVSAAMVSAITERYFREYWEEFRRWRAQIEDVRWDTFVLRPHNAEWFFAYVFHYYPHVRAKVMADLETEFSTALATEDVTK
jgi:hypothetical protein